jgi:Tol biopolymer transport system component
VYLLPLQGERKSKLLFTERAAGMEAISPNGKWIAYESAESGRQEIYVRGFTSGNGKWQVSAEGGSHPSWSANGHELFFYRTDPKAGNSMFSVTVSGGNEFSAGSAQLRFRFPYVTAAHDYAVTPDGQHFICIKQPESEATATQVNVVLNWAKELAGK